MVKRKIIDIKAAPAAVEPGDVNISYKGQLIDSISETRTDILATKNTVVQDDIEIEYSKPASDPYDIARKLVMGTATEYVDPLTTAFAHSNAFAGNPSLTKFVCHNVTVVTSGCLTGSGSAAIAFPNLIAVNAYGLSNSTLATAFDLPQVSSLSGGHNLDGSTKLSILVLRGSSVVPVVSNAFNNTPFATGKTGGTLYVPASLIDEYRAATNWSAILGEPDNTIKSIESTHTDPTAPIDLTRYYIDGTPIPTT